MRQMKTPVLFSDREGKVRYANASARRCGYTVGKRITVAGNCATSYEAVWSGKREVCTVRAETVNAACRALVGVRRCGEEDLAIWVFPACLQLGDLNILSPSLTSAYLSVGEEIIDFVLSQCLSELPLPDLSGGAAAGGRTPASVRRIEQIQGYMTQIATRMSQRSTEQLDGIRYRMHKILALFRLLTEEVFPRSGYRLTFDETALPHIPNAPVPFWPLAVVVTAMLTFALEISEARCAHASYHMDELEFVFDVTATVHAPLPYVTDSHAFARLGMRYADLYPDLLFAVRLAEAMGWSAAYGFSRSAEHNFRLSLALELPDPFVCFLRMSASEPDYDGEFAELLRLLLMGAGDMETDGLTSISHDRKWLENT